MMTPTGKPVCKLLHDLQTNFNQTWHKTFIGKQNYICSNEWPQPLLRGYNAEIEKL